MNTLDHKLETKRLLLSILECNDTLDIEQMHADPEVMALSGTEHPLSKEETLEYCRKEQKQWQEKGYGIYVLRNKATGHFCGCVGLRYIQDLPDPELCWILPRSEWGKGYAIEATRTIKDHAFKKLNIDTLYHYIDRRNTRSIHLAEKLGAQPLKDIEKTIDDLIYVSNRPS